MADHTPGPWTVKNDPVAPERVVVDMGDGIVAVHPFKDWKSNADRARLIAAAPDLLAALESLVVEPLRAGQTNWDWYDRHKAAYAAIAKARGLEA
jgi:hypothetical protein